MSICSTFVQGMFDLRGSIAALRGGFGAALAGRRTGPPANYERGVAALAAGLPNEALRLFAAAGPSARTENKRGVALVKLGRSAEALEAFCCALAYDERYAPALTNVGNLLLDEGALADAVDYYRAAIVSDPDYPGAYRNLSVALRRTGQRGEAVKAWRAAVRSAGRRAGDRA